MTRVRLTHFDKVSIAKRLSGTIPRRQFKAWLIDNTLRCYQEASPAGVYRLKKTVDRFAIQANNKIFIANGYRYRIYSRKRKSDKAILFYVKNIDTGQVWNNSTWSVRPVNPGEFSRGIFAHGTDSWEDVERRHDIAHLTYSQMGQTFSTDNQSGMNVHNIPESRPETTVPQKVLNAIMGNVSQLTKGIEIEFQRRISADEICRAFRAEGLQIENKSTRYHNSSTTKWVLCYDQSVGYWDNQSGLELTSPILRTKEDLITLWKYTQVLNKLDRDGKIRITKKCGLHIHIGNFGSDIMSLKNIFNYYKKNEVIWDSVQPDSRRRSCNEYCGTMINQSDSTSDMNTRYQKVSTRNFWNNGTYEIRHHSGTINFFKIVHWLNIHQNITQEAMAENFEVRTESSLTALLMRFNPTATLVDFFSARLYHLNPALRTEIANMGVDL